VHQVITHQNRPPAGTPSPHHHLRSP